MFLLLKYWIFFFEILCKECCYSSIYSRLQRKEGLQMQSITISFFGYTTLWSKERSGIYHVVQGKIRFLPCGPRKGQLSTLWSKESSVIYHVVQGRVRFLPCGPRKGQVSTLWSKERSSIYFVFQGKVRYLPCGPRKGQVSTGCTCYFKPFFTFFQ